MCVQGIYSGPGTRSFIESGFGFIIYILCGIHRMFLAQAAVEATTFHINAPPFFFAKPPVLQRLLALGVQKSNLQPLHNFSEQT